MASLLKQLQVGLVYAIWSGVGIAATAVIAWLLFKESYDPLAIAGIALVIAGVVVMNLSGSVSH